MPVADWVALVIAIAIIVGGFIGIFIVLNNTSELLICSKVQKRINDALISIFTDYDKDKDYEKALYSTDLILQKELPRSSILTKKYDSSLELLEFFVVDINGGRIVTENKDACKQAVLHFLSIYKKKFPLKQLNGSNAVVLQEMLVCTDQERHLELVNQLAIELKKKEDALQNLHTRKHTSDIIAIIGTITTVISILLGVYQMLT